MRKSVILMLIMLGFSLVVFAATPQVIDYQGYLMEGGAAVSGTKSISFSLYDSLTGGTRLCSSGAQTLTVSKGVFSYAIGSAGCDLSTINFDNAVYLELTVEGMTMSPREQVAGAAYSVQTKAINVKFTPAGSVAATDVQTAIQELDAEKLALSGGTMTGALTVKGAITSTGNISAASGTITANSFSGNGAALTSVVPADNTVTSAKVADNALTAADLAVNVVSSVDGVTNDGGNVDLVAGGGISIVADDAANTITFTAVAGAVDHNSLSNLATGDAHTQYFNLSQNETVAGIPAFNGGTSGSSAPFSVDSTDVVTNLNADLLDGQQGVYYLNTSTSHAGDITGTYNNLQIASGTVGTAEISDGAVASADIADGTIATADLAADSVTSAKIVDGTIVSADIADGTVASADITDLTVATGDVAFNFVGSIEGVANKGGDIDLVAGGGISIVADDAANTITLSAVAGAVDHNSLSNLTTGDVHTQYVLDAGDTMSGTLNMGNNPVTNIDWSTSDDGAGSGLDADLLDGQQGAYYMPASTDNWVNTSGDNMTGNLSVNADILVSGDITAATGTITANAFVGDGTGITGVAATGIADNTITSAKIVDATIVTADLADSSVTSAKIVDGTIAAADIADGATLSEIADDDGAGSGLDADLLDGQQGAYYMPASTDNWVNTSGDNMTGNLSVNADILVSGDITAATGTITANAFVGDGTGITGVAATGIADNTITSAKIVDATIATADLADSSVTSAKIVDGTIAAADIADGATLSEIADDDGAGSGLDADLLDGQQGAYYMPASTDNWVNTSGDNMTGDLNVNANVLVSGDITAATGTITANAFVGDGTGITGVAATGIADNTITSAKIVDATIATADLADSSVTSAKIVDGTIAAADIADGATLSEIADDDGAGSGLDADLLDGQQGSYYVADGCTDCLNATEIEDIYVQKTGDTMTGSLIIARTDSSWVTLAMSRTGFTTVAGFNLQVESSAFGDRMSFARADSPYTRYLTVDGVNSRIGINDVMNPSTALEVNGTVTATAFSGDGSALTSIAATSIADNTITSAKIVDGAVGSADLTDGATLAEIADDDGAGSGLDADLLDGQQGSYYVADGCTDCLNATEIEDIYLLTTGDDMTGPMTITLNSASAGLSTTQTGTGNGGSFSISNATNANSAVYGSTNGTGVAGYFQKTNATNGNATVYSYAGGTGSALYGTSIGAGTVISGNTSGNGTLYGGDHTGGSGNLVQLKSGGATKFTVTKTGDVTATSFSGDGSALTNIAAGSISHNSLANLTTGDPHTQYILAAGDSMTGALSISQSAAAASLSVTQTNSTNHSGYFAVNNASSNQSGVYGTTNGTSSSATGVKGVATAGLGIGVYGQSAGYFGIYGTTTGGGYAGIYGSASWAGVQGYSSGSNAIMADAAATAVGLRIRQNGTGNMITGTNNVSTALFQVDYNGNMTQVGRIAASDYISASVSSASSAISATQTGTGKAADFSISNVANSSSLIYGNTTGTGNIIQLQQNGSDRFMIDSSGSVNLVNSGNSVLEIRGVGGQPFIDFSNDAVSDYDARFYLTTDDKMRLMGADMEIWGAGTGAQPGLYAYQMGASNSAGYFAATSASNASAVLVSDSSGTGNLFEAKKSGATVFTVDNTGNISDVGSITSDGNISTTVSNASPAVSATQAGAGNSVYGYNTGTGRAGYFQIINAGNSSSLISGNTTGTGNLIELQKSGSNMFVVSNTGVVSANCPPSMVPAGSYCVDTNETAADTWSNAAGACVAAGKRLCSPSEWKGACDNYFTNLLNMTGNWEWVDNIISASNRAVYGNGGCSNINTGFTDATANAYRCCSGKVQ